MSQLKAVVKKAVAAVKKAVGKREAKLTFSVDVLAPAHAARTATALFEKTRLERIEQDHGRCWICNRTAEESGHPLEAHHSGIERSFAEGDMDWELVKQDFPNFDWNSFDPAKPYDFVDDMMAQGLILCKEHHTGEGTGIHFMPYSLWVMQRYLKAGYQYTPGEVIIHELT